MATYKVIQDVEAEDKLLGPLTLRQFIYAGVTALCLWLSFLSLAKGVPFALIFFIPIALVSGFLAFPWGRDQPTEIWALARLNFILKPRKRLWNQGGQQNLVTITVPKRVEKNYTDGLSQTEVRSRLNALATTLDSRGWALQEQRQDAVQTQQSEDDRLVSSGSLPQPMLAENQQTNYPITPGYAQPTVYNDPLPDAIDMLDSQNNETASRLNTLVDDSNKAQRQALLAHLKGDSPAPATSAPPVTPSTNWFGPATPIDSAATTNPPQDQATQTKSSSTNKKPKAKKQSVTSDDQAAIIKLAGNDDLDIATISREANRQKRQRGLKDNEEVVIPLR